MANPMLNNFKIKVSSDRLSAHFIIKKAEVADVTREDIFEALEKQKIKLNDEVNQRVDQLMRQIKENQLSTEPFLLAKGREPVHGIPAAFVFAEADRDADGDRRNEGSKIDFRESNITTVQEGAVIGRFIPEKKPVAGVDVFGQPIRANGPGTSFSLGENLKLADDNESVIATVAGMVHLTRRNVSVINVIEIKKDVDYESGNIESPTDVLIHGTVRESFHVKSDKSITVRGAIEAADIKAGGDIHVYGGIIAQNKGKVYAGGEITTKFCHDAIMRAKGDITVIREAMNCQIHTRGRLIITQGALIGGYAYARHGVETKGLGNPTEIRTEVAIGLDPEVMKKSNEIDLTIHKNKEIIAKIRKSVQPLMAQLEQLNPEQRERATGLMHRVDQMEAAIREYEKDKKDLVKSDNPESQVCLLVQKQIHPGAVVIIGDKMTIFHKERKGPVKIVRRLVDRVEEIVVVDQLSGSSQTMPSYPYEPNTAFQKSTG